MLKRLQNQCRQGAFTIIELLVALGMIGVTASSMLWGLSMMNNYAILGRLYSGAMETAQQQVDLVLTDAPFSYSSSQSKPELPSVSSGNSNTSTTSVTVYQDSATGISVSGTMTTKVDNTGATYDLYTSGAKNLNIYRITVTVTFVYRGKTYAVTSATMRAPDSN